MIYHVSLGQDERRPYMVLTQGRAALAYIQKMSRRLSLNYKHFSKRQYVNAAAILTETQLRDSNTYLLLLEIWALEQKHVLYVCYHC